MKRAAIAFALALCTFVQSARAEDPPVSLEAAELLRRGIELRKEHKNEEALDAFTRAVAIDPTPIARAQLALAEQALARWVEAERDLKAALALPDDAWIARNRAALDSAMAIVLHHLGWLEVKVNVPNAQVSFEGRPLASGPARVPSGTGFVEVRAAGYVPDLRRVAIETEQHATIEVELVPVLAAPVAMPLAAKPAPSATASRLGPIALGSVGIVGIGIGAYFGVRTFDAKADRDRHCTPGCDPTGRNADNDARSFARISTIAFVAGATSVAAGVVWLLLTREPSSHSRTRTGVVPFLEPSAAGIVVRGTL